MPRAKKSAPAQPPPLAEFLTKELKDRNLTLLYVEEATGIPDSTLSPIFSGQVPDPKVSQVTKIAVAMGIPWHQIMARVMGEDDTPANIDDEMRRIAVLVADNPDIQSIMGKLPSLGPRDLRAVRKYIELLHAPD